MSERMSYHCYLTSLKLLINSCLQKTILYYKHFVKHSSLSKNKITLNQTNLQVAVDNLIIRPTKSVQYVK